MSTITFYTHLVCDARCLLSEHLSIFSPPSSRCLHPPCRYLPYAIRWRGGHGGCAGYVGSLLTGRFPLSVYVRACARAYARSGQHAPPSRLNQAEHDLVHGTSTLLPIQHPRSCSNSRYRCKRRRGPSRTARCWKTNIGGQCRSSRRRWRQTTPRCT